VKIDIEGAEGRAQDARRVYQVLAWPPSYGRPAAARADQTRGYRWRIANEDEVWQCLAGRGFERCAPETLLVRDPVALFCAAGMIVGNHGSGMLNHVFAPRDVTWAACAALEQPYWYSWGETVENASPAVAIPDLKVSLSRLEASLDQMEAVWAAGPREAAG
jgi:hypothetical protein